MPSGQRALDSVRCDDILAVRNVWRPHKHGDKGGEVGANRLLAARVVPITVRLEGVVISRRLDPAGQLSGRRADVVGLHMHDLRRETGSRLLESPGAALHDVAAWLGHATVTTTAKYLATNTARHLETLRRFEASRPAGRAGGGQAPYAEH